MDITPAPAVATPRFVALLNDSYQTFDRAFQEARLDEYAAERGLDRAGREELGRRFDVLTVQRKQTTESVPLGSAIDTVLRVTLGGITEQIPLRL